GAVFRDDAGQILAAATWYTKGITDPATAEAQAMYSAMEMAAACCFFNVQFESDNLRLINAIRMTDE
ncbi:hypothetical protein A2U01_0118297, partial [Trifolium medium]|nr:hypothetical protein [Trifolium medium]